MGTPGRLLGLFHFLLCTTRLLHWGLHKTSETVKNTWFLTFFGDPFGETNLDHVDKQHVPMQRGARFAFSWSVPMQRGDRFRIFHVPLGGPTWLSEGVLNICKTDVILHILQSIEKRWCARSGCESLKYWKIVAKINTWSEQMRSHAARRSFFIQKGVVREGSWESFLP